MSIDEIRKKIDELDTELVKILAKRIELIKKVSDIKKKKNIPIHDPEREKEIIKEKKTIANELNLNPEFIEEIFEIILKESKNIQNG